jgi:hypothetical protein
MKYQTLIVLLMVHLINLGSQDYIPFDLERGEWYCYYSIKGGFFGGHGSSAYSSDQLKFYCKGNTIFNDTVYKKIFYAGYTSSVDNPKNYVSGYLGAIRNDTINKKVWYNDKVLYDFNIQIGDTLHFGCHFYKVDSYDSIEYCKIYHQRYRIINFDNDTIHLIEGVGLDAGLIPRECAPNRGSLLCYREGTNELCINCEDFTSIDDPLFTLIEIYPNPTDGVINIVNHEQISLIEIYDLNGRLLKTESEDLAQIRLENSGIFILNIVLPNKTILKKVIRY